MSIVRQIIGTMVVKLNEPGQTVAVSIQLIKADEADSSGKGKLGKTTNLNSVSDKHLLSGDNQYTFKIYFDYDDKSAGAFYIRNLLTTEFFLVSLTLEDIPNIGNIHFDCNSWVIDKQGDRIFFANKTYLPSDTPAPLVFYRKVELLTLRGDGTGERKDWERIYDYDVYNDLGNPDKDPSLARPIAGGSSDYPYPRRGRTGRPPTKTDPKSESPSDHPYYIPRDELDVILPFGRSQVNIAQEHVPNTQSVLLNTNSTTVDEFQSGRSVLYKLQTIAQAVPKIHSLSLNKNSTVADDDEFASFEDATVTLYQETSLSVPKVIQVDQSAWKTDEEFAREILAGVNPGIIRVVRDVPPKIKQHSGFEAIQNNRMFVLDYHDTIMPYLRRINSTLFSRTYASRTYLFLANDGTLKPAAIELSLPHPDGDQFGDVSEVYYPAAEGTAEGSLWQLAKAYVVVNDTCFHQLISHWLHTHAVVEPFVIATNRQLSVVHPIYKLLHPHFRNTMNINAAARKTLINANGIIENTYSWAKYAVEMSSILYKDWVFPEQALPADLIKRGMAIKDPTSPHGLRLVIEDYPYAVDGLDIWDAIKTWVEEYVSLYYTSNESVQQDSELQSWWKEVVEVGHGDKKDEKWWPKMQTREELIQSCVTLIWITSALHASVNFGQYPYGGLILNRPTLSRRFIPEKGTADYDELVNFPEQAYLKTIIKKKPFAIMNLSTLELLSTHLTDEFYLGQRESGENWTSDPRALEAFRNFGETLAGIEDKISQRNGDATLRNRVGPVVMPYTLLYPSSGPGITFKGIPNSISI